MRIEIAFAHIAADKHLEKQICMNIVGLLYDDCTLDKSLGAAQKADAHTR